MTSTNLHFPETQPDTSAPSSELFNSSIQELPPVLTQTILEQVHRYLTRDDLPLSFIPPHLKNNPELIISNHLTRVGIPSGLSGYRYLVSAIQSVLEDESILDSITKILYPEIAKLHNSTPQRVEKAIRHAIKTTWDNSSLIHLDEYHFFIRKGRNYPTNTQFIAEIYRKIRLSSVC